MLDRFQLPTVVIRLVGELNASRQEKLAAILEPAAFAEVAVIDLAGVTHFDSIALDCIASLHANMKRCGSRGIIRIARASSSVREAFAVSGLDKLVELFDSASAARITPASVVGTYTLVYE